MWLLAKCSGKSSKQPTTPLKNSTAILHLVFHGSGTRNCQNKLHCTRLCSFIDHAPHLPLHERLNPTRWDGTSAEFAAEQRPCLTTGSDWSSQSRATAPRRKEGSAPSRQPSHGCCCLPISSFMEASLRPHSLFKSFHPTKSIFNAII